MRTIIALLLGFVLGLLATGGSRVAAQQIGRMFGTTAAGNPIPVLADASGNIGVIAH